MTRYRSRRTPSRNQTTKVPRPRNPPKPLVMLLVTLLAGGMVHIQWSLMPQGGAQFEVIVGPTRH